MTEDSIEQAIRKETTADGEHIKCAVAQGLARRLKVSTGEVGDTINRLGIRIIDCQMGFFTVEKASHDDIEGKVVSLVLVEAIKAAQVDGHITCANAFEVAKAFKIPPREVGDTATSIGIKISQCQLGCFP